MDYFTLVDKLMSRLISLKKEGEINNKKLNDIILEPTYQNFLKVHENYMSSFKEYESILLINDVFEEARKLIISKVVSDNLFTAESRGIINYQYATKKSKHEVLEVFFGALASYLHTRCDTDYLLMVTTRKFKDPNAPWMQMHRVSFLAVLENIGSLDSSTHTDSELKAKALDTLGVFVGNLQKKYIKVFEAWDEAKCKLLSL